MQLARLAAVVANGGTPGAAAPDALESVAGPRCGRRPSADLAAEAGRRVAVVRRGACWPVVEEGTGRRAGLDGVAVGGKTGSAQVVTHARLESDRRHDARIQPHGWFMCFAPVERHAGVALAVLVEHGVAGGAVGGAGGRRARCLGVASSGSGCPARRRPDPSRPPAGGA